MIVIWEQFVKVCKSFWNLIKNLKTIWKQFNENYEFFNLKLIKSSHKRTKIKKMCIRGCSFGPYFLEFSLLLFHCFTSPYKSLFSVYSYVQ